MRREGKMWNTYLAKRDTMEGAKLIASVVIAPFEENSELHEKYKLLMREIVKEAIEKTFGKIEKWDEIIAPEHERGGSA